MSEARKRQPTPLAEALRGRLHPPVPSRSPHTARALTARLPRQAQLASRTALSDDGPPLASMAKASTRIDARVRGEVE